MKSKRIMSTLAALPALSVLAAFLVLAACSNNPAPTAAAASPQPYGDLKSSLVLVRDAYAGFKTAFEAAGTSTQAVAAIDELTKNLVPLLKDLSAVARKYPELDSTDNTLPQDIRDLQKSLEDESLVINRLMTQISLQKYAEDPAVQDAVIRFLKSLGVENPELK